MHGTINTKIYPQGRCWTINKKYRLLQSASCRKFRTNCYF